MAATAPGLYCMVQLPADGQSVPSGSSGSIQMMPGTPLAAATNTSVAPSVEDVKQGRSQVQQGHLTPPACDISPDKNTASTAVVAGVNEEGGKCVGEEGSKCVGEEGSKCVGGEGVKKSENVKPLPTAECHTCPEHGPDATDDPMTKLPNVAIHSTATDVTPPQPEEADLVIQLDFGDTSTVLADAPRESDAEGVDGPTTDPLCNKRVQQSVDVEPSSQDHDTNMSLQASAASMQGDDQLQSLPEGGTGGQKTSQQPVSQQPCVEEGQKSQLVCGNTEIGMVLATSRASTDTEVAKELEGSHAISEKKNDEESSAAISPSLAQGEDRTLDTDAANSIEAKPAQEHFSPSESFTGAKPGYVFKSGDQGLGFYIEGYIDRPAKGAIVPINRPWNAGPGEGASRRGPLGPIPKPFKKAVPSESSSAEESDRRPFMARIVAQRNSRGFQSTLLEREHVLDKHILGLLDKFSDPTFFKKKHGYNVHGQMLGKDGKMIVKVTPEKTEEEKAKLSWYRKVYEDRLGKHLPSKRLGDSIEARREAYAYSRHFTAELNNRENELNKALIRALKGQTKLEFITEDYHYPGAYDLHGKVILEKGAQPSNKLQRTDEQNERACTYRYKAIRRYRAAHADILGAISKRDKALHKAIKNMDPATLAEISEEAVTSSGMGIYRQKNRVAERGSETTKTGAGLEALQPTERPEQLRQNFAQSLKAEIRGKDKGLLKDIAAFEEDEVEQMMGEFSKGAEVLPSSWRQDPEGLARIQRRRKELIAENAADRRKVVCPWRPGGKHIARGPWQPFIPRDHRPAVRSASEGKAETHSGGGGTASTTKKVTDREPVSSCGSGKTDSRRRPHTAPTSRRQGFMDAISPRARRVLATQKPGTALHDAFSTYSTDPFPLEARHRSKVQSGSAKTEDSVFTYQPPCSAGSRAGTSFQGTKNRVLTETPGSSTLARSPCGGSTKRPHSAAGDISRKPQLQPPPPRRPATACGTRERSPNICDHAAAAEAAPWRNTAQLPDQERGRRQQIDEPPLDLKVRTGPGVTVLWARLCTPSSDVVYRRSSAWPQAPNASRPTRRRAKTPPTTAATSAGVFTPSKAEGPDERGLPSAETASSAHAEAQSRDKEASRSGDICPLEDLEDSLFASSSQRVKQRRRVFRGYAERSRREHTWDPGSAFYAEGATNHRTPGYRSCNWEPPNKESGRGLEAASSIRDTPNKKRQREVSQRSQVTTDICPVDMDWEKVDVGRFEEASKEIEEALDTKLYAVATHPGQLGDCFQDAQELVESTNVLLGCPEKQRNRFRNKIGTHPRIGNYVAMVSRLNLLWTAIGGVIEIVRMIQQRRDLLEIFRSEIAKLPTAERANTHLEEPEDSARGLQHLVGAPDSAEVSTTERRMFELEKRLDLAEFSVAIAESVKLWMSILPWDVQVLYGGKPVLSSLRAEEETLPWPPDPGSFLDIEDKQADGNIALKGFGVPVQP